jgi:hypothetical protein
VRGLYPDGRDDVSDFRQSRRADPPHPLVDSVADRSIPPDAITGPTQALGEYLFRHQLVNLELAD